MGGWIKLHRDILKWEWYDDVPTKTLFLHLLLVANHEPQNWRGTVIDRGQVLTSRRKLARETKLSEQQIRTCLERLKSTHEVTLESTQRNTVVSICKYEDYQGKKREANPPGNPQSNNQATHDQPSIKQEGKETEEEKKEKSLERAAKLAKAKKAKPGSAGEVVEFCKSIGLPASDGVAMWDKWMGNGFKNNHKAMKCWESTIRSWMHNGYLPSQKRGFAGGSRSHSGAPNIARKSILKTAPQPQKTKS